MSILFSFCDCHWILPWIIPFFLGLFFGTRFISSYRNRVRDLESNQLIESKRFAALSADANKYKAQLEENRLSEISGLADIEKHEYEQQIASLNKQLSQAQDKAGNGDELMSLRSRITELEGELALEKGRHYEENESLGLTSGTTGDGSDSETKNQEIESLRLKIFDLEHELANEKSKVTDDAAMSSDDVVGESARSHSDMAELRQQLLSTQTELRLARGKLQEQDAMHATLDDSKENELLRSRITSLEADLALAKGREYESSEAGVEDQTVLDLRQRLLETEAELALVKGKEYESSGAGVEDPTVIELRQRLLETEAELALVKGNEYEGNQEESKSVKELKQRILSLEADLALEKGKSYEIEEQNRLGSSVIIVQKGKTKAKKKTSKKSEAKKKSSKKSEVKKTNKKDKSEKKKKQKAKSPEESKLSQKTTDKTSSVGKSSSTRQKKSPSGRTKDKASPADKAASGKSKTSTGKKKATLRKSVNQKKKSTARGSIKASKATNATSGFKPAKDGKFSKIKEGDLTIIEGIGPKAAKLLKKKGIKTWADLAAKTPGQLRELLSTQKGFAHVDPSTWTRQANLAAGNHWTRLANLQNDLDGGKPAKKAKKRNSVSKPKANRSKSSTKKLNIKLNNKLKSDNFQLIEGVGPKMNALLVKEGIKSWSDLATYSPGEIRSLLNKHGDKYKIIDVKTWSKQAGFAAKGHWEKLITFQKNDGSDSKAEKVLGKMGVIQSLDTADLKIVEGVGPKIESLLKEAGIKTLGDLAKASKTKLKKILESAGARYGLADPTHWAKQASLANAGKHAELKKLQDRI